MEVSKPPQNKWRLEGVCVWNSPSENIYIYIYIQRRADMEAFAQTLLHVGNDTAVSTGGPNALDLSTGWSADDSTGALIDAIYHDLGPSQDSRVLTLPRLTFLPFKQKSPSVQTVKC